MKALIDDITVEGTPLEIKTFMDLLAWGPHVPTRSTTGTKEPWANPSWTQQTDAAKLVKYTGFYAGSGITDSSLTTATTDTKPPYGVRVTLPWSNVSQTYDDKS